MMETGSEILSQVTTFSKYSKYTPEIQRRETWDEIIDRYELMLLKKFPELREEIISKAKYIRAKKVLPSMRALQFAGVAAEVNNARIYNCCYLPIDSIYSFSEAIFLLLGGTGVGYSVQTHHIEKLPEIIRPTKSKRYLIQDSIIGWADSIKMLMKSYYGKGAKPIFDFRDIRPKGARLITAGGKAPGPEPLKICLAHVEAILDRKKNGEKLSSLEVHDIMCHIANSVLSGGIRRAAMIALFSLDDEEMLTCKYGNWWELNEQRGRANNSTVLERGEVTEEQFRELWKKIELSNSGEPGFYWTKNLDWGTNPSLRAGTKVWTSEGIFPIEKLQDKEFKVTNLLGNISPAKCWLSGKDKELWEITLRGGHKYYATKEHEWAIKKEDGSFIKVKSPELKVGDKLPVVQKDKLGFGDIGTYSNGFLAGWHLGDGWTTVRKEGYLQHGLIVSKQDEVENILIDCLREISVGCNFFDRGSTFELNTCDKNWNAFQKMFGYDFKQNGLPTSVWSKASEEFRKGLIDGLFSSDGSVETGDKKRICYTSKHKKLITDLSELLGFYGIKTSISNSFSILNDKKFERYDLKITGENNIKHFRKIFSLSVSRKQQMLESYSWKKTKTDDNTSIEVTSVKLSDLKEDVWDISVKDETHCFQISHSITGNCCEIALKAYCFCNLCELNVSDIESEEDLLERVKVASFFGTLQASFTDFHYLRSIWQKTSEKDALLGIGMTGIASGEILKYDLVKAANAAKEVNEYYANKIGINKAARVTCLKPSGTTSCVLGTSSGIHAWHDEYYLRTVRYNKSEALAKYLMDKHPELCEDDVLRPHDTLCVRIPIKAPKGSILRTESPISLLERVKKFSVEWIKNGHRSGYNTHNVSATISIKPGEWKDVGDWMWTNRNFYNGLSVIPHDGGSYSQAPFQSITEEQYNERVKHLHSIDLSNVIEEDDTVNFGDIISCAGGACEVN